MKRKLNFIRNNLKINRLSASRDNLTESKDVEYELNLLDIFALLFQNKKLIGAICIALMVITATAVMFIPNKYSSSASILPSGEVDRYSAIKQLAGIGGFGGGTDENSSTLFPTILKSNQVIDNCLEKNYQLDEQGKSTSLMAYYGTDDLNIARTLLRKELYVATDKKTGVIRVGLETESPYLSQAVVAEFINALENYNLNKRKSSAGENVAYLEKEIEARSVELAKAENELESFQAKNRNWAMTSDPTLIKELARLKREVELKLTTYGFLTNQFEIAKLEAHKNIPIVRILDQPNLPTKKSSPARMASILLAGVVGFFLAAFWIILSDAIARYRSRAIANIPVIDRTQRPVKVEV